jgi:hypothetical protein
LATIVVITSVHAVAVGVVKANYQLVGGHDP